MLHSRHKGQEYSNMKHVEDPEGLQKIQRPPVPKLLSPVELSRS